MLEQGMCEDSVKLTISKRKIVNTRHSKACVYSLFSRTILSRTELGYLKIDSNHLPRRNQTCQTESDCSGTAATVQYAHSSTQERRKKGGMLGSRPLKHQPERGFGVARSVGLTRLHHLSLSPLPSATFSWTNSALAWFRIGLLQDHCGSP